MKKQNTVLDQDLVNFFNNLGFFDVCGQGFPSRWQYTDEKLSKINGTADLDKCIKNLFSPINYIDRFEELDGFIREFNKYLAFDKWQVVRDNAQIIFEKQDAIVLDTPNTKGEVSEDEFLQRDFKEVKIEPICLDSALTDILNLRLKEIKNCMKSESPLSSIFLCGSTLEGILLGIASKFPAKFNTARSAPRYNKEKVKQFQDWKLNNFIDVAYELGFLEEDVKRFSHDLRDFRNYIHPYEQMVTKFNPNKHTAKISWQVLKAAIFQIGNAVQQNKPV